MHSTIAGKNFSSNVAGALLLPLSTAPCRTPTEHTVGIYRHILTALLRGTNTDHACYFIHSMEESYEKLFY